MFAKTYNKKMNREAYTSRLKRQLARRKIELPEAQLTEAVNKYYGEKPPSVAAILCLPTATNRTDKHEQAAKIFAPVLEECCKSFELNVASVKNSFDDNHRDLRSVAAYIGLSCLHLRPASALAEAMGLPTPAAVYHLTYRAKRLIKERVVFREKLDEITKTLGIKGAH